MNRKLKISGVEVPAYDIAIKLKVVTKCPGKWKLVDMETVEEYKVELVCEAEYLTAAIAALKVAHPYEEPAYAVIKLEAF